MSDQEIIGKWLQRLWQPELEKLKTFTVDRADLERLVSLAAEKLTDPVPGKEAFR